MKKRVMFQQAGRTEQTAIDAWHRAFDVERAIIGANHCEAKQVGKDWVARSVAEVTRGQYEQINAERRRRGLPEAQPWEEL